MKAEKTLRVIWLPELATELVCSGVPLMASLAAILLNASSSGVVQFIVFLFFAGSALLAFRRLRFDWVNGKFASLAICTGVFGWYAIPAVTSSFSQGNAFSDIAPVSMGQETTILAVAYLSLFMTSWVLSSRLFSGLRFFDPLFPVGSKETNIRRLVWLGIACCGAGLIPYVVSGLDIREVLSLIVQGRMAEKPWLHRDNLGDFRSPFLYLGHSAMAAGSCVLWLVAREKTSSPTLRLFAGIIAFVFTMLIFIDQGTRSTVALILLPAFLMQLSDIWKRSKVFFTISASALGVLFISLLQLQLAFRDSGFGSDIPEILIRKWITLGDTTDLFSETLFCLRIVPSLHEYFKESVLVQFLVSPIPRFMWPSKPASEVVWFYTLQRWGVDIYEGGGNVFPGIVGQYYMSWGGWGPILLGGFSGWFSSRVDDFLVRASSVSDSYHRAVGIMLSVWLLLSFRVLSPGFLYPVILVFLIVQMSSTRHSGISNREQR